MRSFIEIFLLLKDNMVKTELLAFLSGFQLSITSDFRWSFNQSCLLSIISLISTPPFPFSNYFNLCHEFYHFSLNVSRILVSSCPMPPHHLHYYTLSNKRIAALSTLIFPSKAFSGPSKSFSTNVSHTQSFQSPAFSSYNKSYSLLFFNTLLINSLM